MATLYHDIFASLNQVHKMCPELYQDIPGIGTPADVARQKRGDDGEVTARMLEQMHARYVEEQRAAASESKPGKKVRAKKQTRSAGAKMHSQVPAELPVENFSSAGVQDPSPTNTDAETAELAAENFSSAGVQDPAGDVHGSLCAPPAQVHNDAPAYDASECTICLSEPRTHAFFPCGHLCVCETCAQACLQGARPACPQCLAPSQNAVKIFWS